MHIIVIHIFVRIAFKDVVIPTSSADKQNIILKEGQKVMVLKSPKGIYMQLESGKIIAIRTALKVGHNKDKSSQETPFMAREMQKRSIAAATTKSIASPTSTTAANNSSATTTSTVATTSTKTSIASTPLRSRSTTNHVQFGRSNTGLLECNDLLFDHFKSECLSLFLYSFYE